MIHFSRSMKERPMATTIYQIYKIFEKSFDVKLLNQIHNVVIIKNKVGLEITYRLSLQNV